MNRDDHLTRLWRRQKRVLWLCGVTGLFCIGWGWLVPTRLSWLSYSAGVFDLLVAAWGLHVGRRTLGSRHG